jgi:hypothetical protein
VRLVLHVPHSSRDVPAHERHSLLLSDDALQQELLHMTDAYTDESAASFHLAPALGNGYLVSVLPDGIDQVSA